MELLRHPEFRAGFHDEARVMPDMLAWGLVEGVAMVKGGFSTGAALVMALLAFLLSARELPMPPALRRGLRYAPLGALMAVVLPEVVLEGGALPATLLDARIVAALVTATYASWRRTDMLGTIVVGMATYLLLRD
jgi:branched-subunit amino acid transport protein